MIISNHQIQNVLKVYTSQLSHGRFADSLSEPVRKPFVDAVDVSVNGKRQALIERLTKAIVGRITRKDPRLQDEHPIVEQIRSEIESDFVVRGQAPKQEILYNVIDRDAEKTLHTLSVKDPADLIKQLEHHARNTIEKNLE